MTTPGFEPVNRAGQLRAGELERLAHAAEQLDRVSGDRGVLIGNSAAGTPIALDRPRQFWARITGGGGIYGNLYTFVEVYDAGNGTYPDLPGGITSAAAPAYERGRHKRTPIGRIVRMRPNPQANAFDFSYCCDLGSAGPPHDHHGPPGCDEINCGTFICCVPPAIATVSPNGFPPQIYNALGAAPYWIFGDCYGGSAPDPCRSYTIQCETTPGQFVLRGGLVFGFGVTVPVFGFGNPLSFVATFVSCNPFMIRFDNLPGQPDGDGTDLWSNGGSIVLTG